MPVFFSFIYTVGIFSCKKEPFFACKAQISRKCRQESLVNYRIVSIFEGPRPCAMTICGQLARAKAATDL